MKTIRSFLGIKLGLKTAQALAEVQMLLKDRCAGAGIRIGWVPPPNMHVTIRFLGQITEPMAYAIKDMLEPVVGGMNAFEFETAGLGVFPNLHKPRIIWAGIKDGAKQLEELHKDVTLRLTEAGFHLDDKPFRAHVTLGRIKGGQTGSLVSCLHEEMETHFGSTAYPELVCYRSDLKPQGAEYYALWHLPFVRNVENSQHRTAMPGSEIS